MMSPATMLASTVVSQWFTNTSITSLRRVNKISGTRAKGSPSSCFYGCCQALL